MVHPPRPGAQWRHQTPCGLSNSSTLISLQHSEQSPQLRPATSFGVCASVFMTGLGAGGVGAQTSRYLVFPTFAAAVQGGWRYASPAGVETLGANVSSFGGLIRII